MNSQPYIPSHALLGGNAAWGRVHLHLSSFYLSKDNNSAWCILLLHGWRYYELGPNDPPYAAKFYDCCGAEDPEASGCTTSLHVSYDDDCWNLSLLFCITPICDWLLNKFVDISPSLPSNIYLIFNFTKNVSWIHVLHITSFSTFKTIKIDDILVHSRSHEEHGALEKRSCMPSSGQRKSRSLNTWRLEKTCQWCLGCGTGTWSARIRQNLEGEGNCKAI